MGAEETEDDGVSGDETPGDAGPTADAFVPGGVGDLVEYVASVDTEVLLLRRTGGDRRGELVVDVAPVPAGVRTDVAPAVDVWCLNAGPPVASPVPLAEIESIRPVPDAETATAALPADPRARAAVLRELASRDPTLVDVAVVLPALDRRASADRGLVIDALGCLTSVAHERPDDCVAAVPQVRTLVSETVDREVRTGGLAYLAALAATRPEEVAPHVAVATPSLDATDPAEATAAVACVSHVAGAEPGAVVDCVADLVAMLDTDDSERRMRAAYAIGRVAVVDPAAVRTAVPRLVATVADQRARTATRLNATCAVGRVVGDRPAAVVDHLPTFVDTLCHGDAGLRANAAGVVGDLAATHAVDVRRHVAPLVARLDDEDEVVRVNGSTALARVAREFPEAVAEHVAALIDGLDDEASVVRENVCWSLGYLRGRARTARPPLERVRAGDADGRVRDRACWALDRVEGGADGDADHDGVGIGD
ncbi:HEAT repeat domain-containing protein [Salinigranum marinum]|uniref:HEAT repeat domain-containing protein n=1 Tax=Salinigranum marinum TaxID=1515595 RepID=UPI00298A007B|nr:HEAT repeat domain-containing protein [Salinigranum marinum]